eukprot:10686_1
MNTTMAINRKERWSARSNHKRSCTTDVQAGRPPNEQEAAKDKVLAKTKGKEQETTKGKAITHHLPAKSKTPAKMNMRWEQHMQRTCKAKASNCILFDMCIKHLSVCVPYIL